jgi:hypothetical protein
MPVLSTIDASSLFFFLSSTVKEFAVRGQPCLAARLKIELRRRSGFTFSEQQLGFAKFGDFLRAAESAGFVRVQETPGGDLRVFPADPQSSATPSQIRVEFKPQSTPGVSIPTNVRQDLWNAFNSLSDSWVYDRSQDIAFKWHGIEGQAPPEAATQLIRIPSGKNNLLGWMKAFANMQQPEMRETLTAVAESKGFFTFVAMIRNERALYGSWRRFHIQQVVTTIQAWAASNCVAPKNVTTPRFGAVRQIGASVAEHAAPGPVPESFKPPLPTINPDLGNRLELLIDDLVGELLQLRGFVQMLRARK